MAPVTTAKAKMGIDETKKLFIVIVDMGNACGAAFEDGKIGLGDIKDLMNLAHDAKDLASIDYKKVLPELESLTPAEMDELAKIVDDNLDIPEELIADHVKKLFGVATRLTAIISEMIHLVKTPEAVG